MQLNALKCKMGDFGCGEGYTTLCLALEIDDSECIGIDQFTETALPYVPSIKRVQRQFQEMKDLLKSEANSAQWDELIREIHLVVQEQRLPQFVKGNIVTGTGLPSNLDLAYCKKVLKNIADGTYGNPRNSTDSLEMAIRNIVRTVKPSGQICVVEPACEIDFKSLLRNAGPELLECSCVDRGEIAGNRRVTLYKAQYIRYLCRMP